MPEKIKKKRFQKTIKSKNSWQQKRKSKHIILVLLFLVILLGVFVGVSLAKYETQIQTKAFASIAKPILEIETQKSMLITALATKATYVFEVRNYKEEQLNEVEMEYYIEIISHTDESIQFSLYRGETLVPLTENKTENIKLTKEEKQVHSYRLEITYEEAKTNKQEDIKGNVEIKIHSIQKA